MLSDVAAMKAAAPFGGEPAGLLDVAVAVAEGSPPPDPQFTEAARAAAPLLAHAPAGAAARSARGGDHGPALGAGLQWMHDAGVLGALLPELEATVDFSQEAGRRHKDVWEHTKQVVRQAVPRPIVRWAALLHDIGKVKTRVICPTAG